MAPYHFTTTVDDRTAVEGYVTILVTAHRPGDVEVYFLRRTFQARGYRALRKQRAVVERLLSRMREAATDPLWTPSAEHWRRVEPDDGAQSHSDAKW